MWLLSLRQSKECYKGRMLQGNANTTINGGMNASKKKIRTELLTIRAATFWNSLLLGVVEISNTITLKMDHTDVTEGTGCGCLHQLGTKHNKSRSLSHATKFLCDDVSKQVRVN